MGIEIDAQEMRKSVAHFYDLRLKWVITSTPPSAGSSAPGAALHFLFP